MSGCSVELYHSLPEQDANDIYVLLQENGINALKVKEEAGNQPTYMVTVPKQDAASASRLLKEYALPRPKIAGLKIFADKKGMIPTPTEERAMFLEALGGEVSMALNRIDGVLDARTIVMMPEVTDLTQPENKPPNSASVLVRYRPVGEGSQPPLTDEQIRKFVATSLPDMKPENVTVLLSPARPLPAGARPDMQLKDVLGMRMTASSASTFRLFVAVTGLLVLVMAGLTTYHFMRGSIRGMATIFKPRPKTERSQRWGGRGSA
ncbi:MAG TPA: type III secretion protein [Myxococcaceae bacterium]|nr:type III secretion protein [Myxococcaceae bacterium]